MLEKVYEVIDAIERSNQIHHDRAIEKSFTFTAKMFTLIPIFLEIQSKKTVVS
ncbi:hypothetical protein [Bartonella sp. JB63]|uniref:hypothetical protein n=1 Tax=Bartonella sp. JB63 TaxID=1933907 RepID=UPI0009C39052|nr:hypothetical protein BJB15x_006960 [Bartonella sp. JB15]AQX29369.1 hypothetical protein BJB63x_006860 [Bartonella sp. JB63]